MGILDWLTVVFVILKLTGVIAWSWWLVLAPFWVPFCIALIAGAMEAYRHHSLNREIDAVARRLEERIVQASAKKAD